eukprot:1543632-Amphidinium_carterae.1
MVWLHMEAGRCASCARSVWCAPGLSFQAGHHTRWHSARSVPSLLVAVGRAVLERPRLHGIGWWGCSGP